MNIIVPAFEQMLIFLPLALAVYLSYSILRITDLTVEGSFVLGAAVFAHAYTSGLPQGFALVLALLSGASAGVCVSIMQRYGRINSLIAGILAVFMLYSVNFQAMGRPNISLLTVSTWLGELQDQGDMVFWSVVFGFVLILVILFCLMLYSRFGLLLRASGSNMKLLSVMGKPVFFYRTFGLALSNALAALCGVMMAQNNGYADVNMGLGMALTAIGSVVIGLQLIQSLLRRSEKFNAWLDCLGCALGAFIYYLAMNGFLYFGIDPVNLKFVLGLVLVVFLSAAAYSENARRHVDVLTTN